MRQHSNALFIICIHQSHPGSCNEAQTCRGVHTVLLYLFHTYRGTPIQSLNTYRNITRKNKLKLFIEMKISWIFLVEFHRLPVTKLEQHWSDGAAPQGARGLRGMRSYIRCGEG